MARRDHKWGFIDTGGKAVIPIEYDDVGFFREGLAYVKLRNKYGFIDKAGKLVLPLRYDDVRSFEGGKARVKLSGREFYLDKDGNELSNVTNPNTSSPISSSTNTVPAVSASSSALINALKNSRWLEHDVTIEGEKVYLEFESNGRVRTRTSSDPTGFVASNESWYVNEGILYVDLLDSSTNKAIAERSGTLIGDRIEGKDKDLVNGGSTKWLLTRVE